MMPVPADDHLSDSHHAPDTNRARYARLTRLFRADSSCMLDLRALFRCASLDAPRGAARRSSCDRCSAATHRASPSRACADRRGTARARAPRERRTRELGDARRPLSTRLPPTSFASSLDARRIGAGSRAEPTARRTRALFGSRPAVRTEIGCAVERKPLEDVASSRFSLRSLASSGCSYTCRISAAAASMSGSAHSAPGEKAQSVGIWHRLYGTR